MSLVAVGMALLTTRFWGLSQAYVEFQTHFFDDLPFLVMSWDDLKAASASHLWADLVQTKDKNLYFIPFKEAQKKKNFQWLDRAPQGVGGGEILEKYKNKKWILNIKTNSNEIDLQVAKLLENSAWDHRVLLVSDYDNILQSVKKLKPQLLFGSTISDKMRLRTFQSMGILPATPFKADVYVGEIWREKIEILDIEIFNELRRRKKQLLLLQPFGKPLTEDFQNLPLKSFFQFNLPD